MKYAQSFNRTPLTSSDYAESLYGYPSQSLIGQSDYQTTYDGAPNSTPKELRYTSGDLGGTVNSLPEGNRHLVHHGPTIPLGVAMQHLGVAGATLGVGAGAIYSLIRKLRGRRVKAKHVYTPAIVGGALGALLGAIGSGAGAKLSKTPQQLKADYPELTTYDQFSKQPLRYTGQGGR